MKTFCRKAEDLFPLNGEEIEKSMEEYYHDNLDAEKKSWRVSLPLLIQVIKAAGLGNIYLAAEYELPSGGRIDAVLLGEDAYGSRNALIVELKQWSIEGIEYHDNRGSPSIIVNAKKPYPERHPVNQTKEYTESLKSNHSSAVNGELHIYGCQFLHGFDRKDKAFFYTRPFCGR